MSKNEVSTVQSQNEVGLQFSYFNPSHFETMQRVAKMFSNSELVPDMYKVSEGNPPEKATANCVVAIEMAQRIGASPLMVMQNMIIIYGRPSWSSKFLIACVNACGRFEPMQYSFKDLGKIENVKYTEYVWNAQAKKKLPTELTFKGPVHNIQCIAWSRKRGGDEILESIPVTIEMAIKEGWYTKNGSKWQTMERLMLTYRAASFWTSAYAPELSMGIKTTEEVMDIQDIDFEEVIDKRIKANANKIDLIMDEPEPKMKEGPPQEKPKEEPKEPKKENKVAETPNKAGQAEPLFK